MTFIFYSQDAESNHSDYDGGIQNMDHSSDALDHSNGSNASIASTSSQSKFSDKTTRKSYSLEKKLSVIAKIEAGQSQRIAAKEIGADETSSAWKFASQDWTKTGFRQTWFSLEKSETAKQLIWSLSKTFSVTSKSKSAQFICKHVDNSSCDLNLRYLIKFTSKTCFWLILFWARPTFEFGLQSNAAFFWEKSSIFQFSRFSKKSCVSREA